MFNTQSVILKKSSAASAIFAALRIIPKLPTLIFEMPICSFSRKISECERQEIINILAKGDILLTSDKIFPLLQFAEGVMGSPRYSHAAIYAGNNTVIEATTFHPSGNGVAQTEINDFLSGRKNIGVVRPSYLSEHNKETMFEWLQQQLGKPYDYNFSTKSNGAMYCSKLVAKAMRVAGFPIEKTNFLWCKQYLPDYFIHQPEMETVYYSRQTRLSKIVGYLPFISIISAFFAGSAVFNIFLIIIIAALVSGGWLQLLKIV